MKTVSTLYSQSRRIYERSIKRARSEAAKAHPETQGNPEAKAAWERHQSRIKGVDAIARRLAASCDHHQHIAASESGRYLWCPHCQGLPMPSRQSSAVFSLSV